jgi:hypothetical protein
MMGMRVSKPAAGGAALDEIEGVDPLFFIYHTTQNTMTISELTLSPLHPNAMVYRRICYDSRGAITISAPTTFDEAYTGCLPEHPNGLLHWHIRVRQVVRSELNDFVRRYEAAAFASAPPAFLVGYDDALADVNSREISHVRYYIQYCPTPAHTLLFPANLELPAAVAAENS